MQPSLSKTSRNTVGKILITFFTRQVMSPPPPRRMPSSCCSWILLSSPELGHTRAFRYVCIHIYIYVCIDSLIDI